MALPHHSTNRFWKTLVAEPVHHDIGDGFHVDDPFAPGLPVDGARRQVIASSNGSAPAGSTACASGLLMILDGEGGALLPAAAAFCSSASAFFSVPAGPVAAGCCERSTLVCWQPTRHRLELRPQPISGASVDLAHKIKPH